MNALPYPTNQYDSPHIQTGLIAALFPTLSFYLKTIYVITTEAKLAKKGPYTGADWARASHRVLNALESIGVKLHVQGMDIISQVEGPCVFIGNHMSTLETFILPILIQPRKDVTFVVKQSLIDYPVFKYVLRSRDPITVSRNNPREDLQAVLEGGEARLKAGRSVVIFPQSTRSDTLDTDQFNSIGIKLARRAKVPVIPIALLTDAWRPGSIVKDFGPIHTRVPVHFEFGAPFTVTGNGKEDHANMCKFIQERLAFWRSQTPKV